MIIDFKKIDETVIDGFKGGKGEMRSRAVCDSHNRIMLNRLRAGASSGYHAHADNCEMIYVISGELLFRCAPIGVEESAAGEESCGSGSLHYCPKGYCHSFRSVGGKAAAFLAIVPEQR